VTIDVNIQMAPEYDGKGFICYAGGTITDMPQTGFGRTPNEALACWWVLNGKKPEDCLIQGRELSAGRARAFAYRNHVKAVLG
jgi:hypothetical protein